MKLIYFIALTQILVSVVNFCSARTYTSPFIGRWCELELFRCNVEQVMKEMHLPPDLIVKYINGNASNLDIEFKQYNEAYKIAGKDPAGQDINFTIEQDQKNVKEIDFSVKELWYKSSYSNDFLNINFYSRPGQYLLNVIVDIKLKKFLRFRVNMGRTTLTATTWFIKCDKYDSFIN